MYFENKKSMRRQDLDDWKNKEIFCILPGFIDGYSRNSGLSGSTVLNSSSNIGRDDSSGSEDNIESQSVQFYLGNAPPTPAITPRTPQFEGLNHVSNHNHTNSANVSAASAAAITSAAAATGQQQQHACNNDRYLL